MTATDVAPAPNPLRVEPLRSDGLDPAILRWHRWMVGLTIVGFAVAAWPWARWHLGGTAVGRNGERLGPVLVACTAMALVGAALLALRRSQEGGRWERSVSPLLGACSAAIAGSQAVSLIQIAVLRDWYGADPWAGPERALATVWLVVLLCAHVVPVVGAIISVLAAAVPRRVLSDERKVRADRILRRSTVVAIGGLLVVAAAMVVGHLVIGPALGRAMGTTTLGVDGVEKFSPLIGYLDEGILPLSGIEGPVLALIGVLAAVQLGRLAALIGDRAPHRPRLGGARTSAVAGAMVVLGILVQRGVDALVPLLLAGAGCAAILTITGRATWPWLLRTRARNADRWVWEGFGGPASGALGIFVLPIAVLAVMGLGVFLVNGLGGPFITVSRVRDPLQVWAAQPSWVTLTRTGSTLDVLTPAFAGSAGLLGPATGMAIIALFMSEARADAIKWGVRIAVVAGALLVTRTVASGADLVGAPLLFGAGLLLGLVVIRGDKTLPQPRADAAGVATVVGIAVVAATFVLVPDASPVVLLGWATVLRFGLMAGELNEDGPRRGERLLRAEAETLLLLGLALTSALEVKGYFVGQLFSSAGQRVSVMVIAMPLGLILMERRRGRPSHHEDGMHP